MKEVEQEGINRRKTNNLLKKIQLENSINRNFECEVSFSVAWKE